MTTESAEEVCGSINDLESVFTIKSYDELNKVLDEHFYCRSTSEPAGDSWNTPSAPSSEKPAPTAAPAKTESAAESVDDVDPLDDDKVKELLDGLGD